jgi:hypothetical protein
MAKRKSGFHEPARNHATAFDDEFRFGAKEKGADFQHPFRRRETNRHPAGLAEYFHHFRVRDRIGRSYVNCTAQDVMSYEPFNRPAKIIFVDP